MGFVKQYLWNIGWDISSYILQFVLILSVIQLAWQVILAGIKHYYLRTMVEEGPEARGREPLGIPFLRGGGEILGLTGDNSPKKRIVEHLVWKTYSLPFVASVVLCWWHDWNFIIGLILSALWSYALKESRCFTLLKMYSESGVGFNLYFEGWRLIGFDYHNWQVKQDAKTGKALKPDEQFFCDPRFHIDIPNWNIHHWPWEQHQDPQMMKEAMAAKKAKKEEQQKSKQAKKLLKQQRRAKEALAALSNPQPAGGNDDEEDEIPTMEDIFG